MRVHHGNFPPIIGPGFNYKFNALDPNGQINDLEDALTRLMHSPQAQRQTAMRLVQVQIPILRLLVLIECSFGVLLTHTCIQPTPGGKIVDEARTKMGNIAKKLLSDSQADIKSGGISASQRDLLSLLVQSNMSSEIQEHQRLSDAEVVARTSFVSSVSHTLFDTLVEIPTFFVAGHESGCRPIVSFVILELSNAFETATRSVISIRQTQRLFDAIIFQYSNRSGPTRVVYPSFGSIETSRGIVQHRDRRSDDRRAQFLPISREGAAGDDALVSSGRFQHARGYAG
jgi:hypothetical protein